MPKQMFQCFFITSRMTIQCFALICYRQADKSQQINFFENRYPKEGSLLFSHRLHCRCLLWHRSWHLRLLPSSESTGWAPAVVPEDLEKQFDILFSRKGWCNRNIFRRVWHPRTVQSHEVIWSLFSPTTI